MQQMPFMLIQCKRYQTLVELAYSLFYDAGIDCRFDFQGNGLH